MFWRRRRAKIAATTDSGVKDQPPREVISEDEHRVGMDSWSSGVILGMERREGEGSRTRDMAAREQGVRTDAMIPQAADIPKEAQVVRKHALTGDVPTQAQDLTELPSEVDDLIVSKLMSLSDRCILQGVSRRWRTATRHCVTPPLPLILNADLAMINCFADGPQAVPLQMNSNVSHPIGHQITCLGSLNSLIILAYDKWIPEQNLALPHTSCLLVQPVNGSTTPLPNPCSVEMNEAVSGSLQVVGGHGLFSFSQPVKTSALRLKKAVLSQSSHPDECIVVALATQRGAQHIVFSTPMMSSWYICSADFITVGADIEFLGDKIIILGSNQEAIFQIDFGAKLSFFPVVCEIKRCMVLDLPQVDDTHQQLNLIRADSDLLVLARYFTLNWEQLTAVRVFRLDPVSWTLEQIHTLGERSILVSLSCSQSIAAGSGEMDPKADHVYFLDLFCPQFLPGEEDNFAYRSQVYSMQDGAVSELLIGSGRGSRSPGFPMWFFPSE